jgi:uncharacterized protein (DUF2267 family)
VETVSTTESALFEGSVQKAREWVHDLARELGRPEDPQYAFRVLRSFLHVLRDRLPVEEAAAFAAQLPELLRGVYYEGWRPADTPQSYHDLNTFLDRIAAESRLAGETEAAYAGEAAIRVVAAHVGVHEVGKVRLVLPRDIADFLDPSTEAHHVGS